MASLSGVITAMATPFAEDGALDLESARALATHLVENGSHGLVVAGTTGESPTLSDQEKLRLLDAVLDEVGDRATVIAGTGSNDTRHSVELTGAAAKAGAHAVLVVTPYYNKPSRAGLRAHFHAVAEAAGETPVVLYNIPSRCAINVPPDMLADLAARDSQRGRRQAGQRRGPRADRGHELLAGNDDGFLRTLELGGAGGILVASHVVGREMRALYEAQAGGDARARHELDAELEPIYRALSRYLQPDARQDGSRDARGGRRAPPAADGAREPTASATRSGLRSSGRDCSSPAAA